MKRTAPPVVLLAALLALTGCTGGTNDVDRDTTPSPSATIAPEPSTGPNPEPPSADDATVIPVPKAGATSQQEAIAAAEAVVAAFGQPDLSYQAWINGLYPFMTQSGAAAYEGTDPQNIPVREVTGDGEILDGSTDVALIVEVPTNDGPYNVSLSRATPDAPWLADRIRPAGT